MPLVRSGSLVFVFQRNVPKGIGAGAQTPCCSGRGGPAGWGALHVPTSLPPNFTVLASLSFISSDLGSSRLCNPPANLPHPKPGHRPTPRTGQAIRTTKMKVGTMVAEVSRESCAPSARRRRSAFHVLAALRGRLSLSRLADENTEPERPSASPRGHVPEPLRELRRLGFKASALHFPGICKFMFFFFFKGICSEDVRKIIILTSSSRLH